MELRTTEQDKNLKLVGETELAVAARVCYLAASRYFQDRIVDRTTARLAAKGLATMQREAAKAVILDTELSQTVCQSAAMVNESGVIARHPELQTPEVAPVLQELANYALNWPTQPIA